MAVITDVRRRRLRCRLEVAAGLPVRPPHARSWRLHRSNLWQRMLEDRYAGGAISPARAFAEGRKVGLFSRARFDDDEAVVAENGRQVRGKPVLQGRKHLVGWVDQHEIVAATGCRLGRESPQRVLLDHPRAGQSELVEVA